MSFKTRKKDYLLIQLTGFRGKFKNMTCLAKVIESRPLKVQVTESGPLSSINSGDFMPLPQSSAVLQEDIEKGEKLLTILERIAKKLLEKNMPRIHVAPSCAGFKSYECPGSLSLLEESQLQVA